MDIIIALTHVGLARDRELAQGPFPVVETSPEGRLVLVAQAGGNGEFLGRLTVTFDARGVAVAWEGEPVLLKDRGA